MFVRHQVGDYAAWRKIYDDFDARRREMGVTAHAVYRSTDNPNEVTATHEFASVEAAQQFAASADLREAMGRAGVVGAPSIWFASKA
jgi:quinol monooxygenase YgiN